MDTATVSKRTRNYLNKAEKSGVLINVAEDLPKSFVVCQKEKKQHVYLSGLSTNTLLKRNEIKECFKGENL